MSNALKPLIVIVLAVAVAAGAAVYLSRQPDQPAETAAAATRGDFKVGGPHRGAENAPFDVRGFGE